MYNLGFKWNSAIRAEQEDRGAIVPYKTEINHSLAAENAHSMGESRFGISVVVEKGNLVASDSQMNSLSLLRSIRADQEDRGEGSALHLNTRIRSTLQRLLEKLLMRLQQCCEKSGGKT